MEILECIFELVCEIGIDVMADAINGKADQIQAQRTINMELEKRGQRPLTPTEFKKLKNYELYKNAKAINSTQGGTTNAKVISPNMQKLEKKPTISLSGVKNPVVENFRPKRRGVVIPVKCDEESKLTISASGVKKIEKNKPQITITSSGVKTKEETMTVTSFSPSKVKKNLNKDIDLPKYDANESVKNNDSKIVDVEEVKVIDANESVMNNASKIVNVEETKVIDVINNDVKKEEPISSFEMPNLNSFDKKEDEYDERGFNSKGYHKNGTRRDNDGYDKDGYSIFGYDKDGYDKSGYNRLGYNRMGYDKDGYDSNGYNKDGINRFGLKRN